MKQYINSRNSTLLTALIFILIFINRGVVNYISWDIFGQYCYLPSLFIEKTFYLSYEYFEQLNQTYNFSSTLYQFNHAGDFVYSKYTSGLALLFIPFFLIAHLFANFLGYPMDGYSLPYTTAFWVGCLFYTVISLFVLRKVLLLFFEDKIVTWIVPLVFFGTNLYALSILPSTFTHNLSFLFVGLLLLATNKFHKNPTIRNGIYLGVSLGILGLIRIPDLLFGCIPVFWGIKQYGSFWNKIKFFLQKKEVLATVFISFLLIIGIQLIFWYSLTGHFFVNSYANNPGEGFDWLQPHTKQFLLSFKRGWLLYTPLSLLGLLGFVQLYRKYENGKIISISFVLFLYVVSTWTTWWYAESFSQRAMVDSYPMFAIALGALLSNIRWKRLFFGICSLFIFLNMFQTWQMTKGILSDSSMTKPYYFSIFGQTTSPTEKQLALLEKSRIEYESIPFENLELKQLYEWHSEIEDGYLDSLHLYSPDFHLDLSDYYYPDILYIVKAQWSYAPVELNRPSR
ncbi:MAG: hypothetical protein M9897_11805 [Brumimicrobium sp.]|nr:hypothetical protein [Brumimicrobium sp.]